MDLEYFPHFIRVSFPALELSDNECLYIGGQFKEYLKKKFVNNFEKLNDIWNIDIINVLKNCEHPARVNGYHPAFIIHFQNFVKETLENN